MRAIIIEEERFAEIVKRLRLECERVANDDPRPEFKEGVRVAARTINYHLVRWMQSHGASFV